MKRQLLFVLLGMIFFAVIIGSVSVYLFTSNQASHLASSLSSRVAVATGLNGILQQTTYDESFLDPHDAALRITGASWQGVIEIQQRADPYVHLTALTAAGSQLEADCLAPTSAVGVQFWGDENEVSHVIKIYSIALIKFVNFNSLLFIESQLFSSFNFEFFKI